MRTESQESFKKLEIPVDASTQQRKEDSRLHLNFYDAKRMLDLSK